MGDALHAMRGGSWLRDRLGLRRLAGATVVGLGVALIMAASARATSGWVATTNLYSVQNGYQGSEPQVATNAQGDSVAVWAQTSSGLLVEASVHEPDGIWQSETQVGYLSGGAGPQAVSNGSDGFTVAWPASDGIEASDWTLGAGWSAPVTIGGGGTDLQLASNAERDMAVAGVSSSNVINVANRTAGGTWQQPVPVAVSAESSSSPQVALDEHGNTVAVWQQDNGSYEVIEAAVRPAASGVWQEPVTVSSNNENAGAPALAIDPAGEATVVWAGGGVIKASDLPPGGTWSAPASVSASGAASPQVVSDAQGDLTAAWNQTASSNTAVDVAQRPAGGTWSTPQQLSSPQASTNPPNPYMVGDARGDIAITWDGYDSTYYTAQAGVKLVGGSWQLSGSLSGAGDQYIPNSPRVAIDPEGNATADWETNNGYIQAAGYIGAGPLFQSVSIPSTGIVGVPLTLSASPVAPWSPVGETTWSFGDGATASGTNVMHTYASAGSYAVKVTSTDALGNLNSSTGTITIAAAPAVGGGVGGAAAPPTLTALSESHKRWREGSKRATVTAKKLPPVGTSFSFTVNQQARAGLSFSQTVAGRRVAGKCRAPKPANRHDHACKRSVVRGALHFSVNRGRHRVVFAGSIGGKRLPLGSYVLAVTAVSTSSGRSSAKRTLQFTIVK